MKKTIRLTVNGRLYEEDVEPRILLSHFLRETIGLTGTHVGCVVGEWALIADHEPTYEDPERPTRLQPLHASTVRVGDGARIGAHASLPAGATVGPGEVVGSYVTRAPRSDS